MVEPVGTFTSNHAALAAIVDFGRQLATRLALVQALRRGDLDPQGQARGHDVARAVATYLIGPDAEEQRSLADRIAATSRAIDEQFDALVERLVATATAGHELPLHVLSRTLHLSLAELRVIMALAAIAFDPELERAYYMAFDTPGRRLDVGWLALLIGGLDFVAQQDVIAGLGAEGALRRHRLVVLGDGAHVFRAIRLADPIVAMLRGEPALDEAIAPVARLVSRRRDELVLPDAVVERLRGALALDGAEPCRVHVVGPDGIGKAALVEALAADAKRAALRVDLGRVLAAPAMFDLLAACGREAALRDGIIVVDGGAVTGELDHVLLARLGDALRALPVPLALVTTAPLPALATYVPDLVEVAVPPPTLRDREALWRRALAGSVESPEVVATIAGRYSFGGSVIANAARRATTSARLRDPSRPLVKSEDLDEAARAMFSHRLGAVAQRIPAGFTWDDLVVPPETKEQIDEVVRFARLRPHLLETWGFARKLPYGRGISAIMAGPPGTGKTMVAQLLAGELGYDLYRVDLAQVVNKYIGETEKSLARIFAEAEHSHAVLFFDEADSLFAKRTDVKSSNDRYANLEVNYLLQRMETFDGVTLLATNIEQGIDEAFKRRVRFTIEFELPDEAVRATLWSSMIPKETPTAAGIDWDELAKRFEMSGGYIKKAVVRAALAAAEAGRPLAHADLMTAALHEYRAMGRVMNH